jgi:DNA polymerase
MLVAVDFETQSLCDLRLCGAERYSEDPSTSIICLVYKVNGIWRTWVPGTVLTQACDLNDLACDPYVMFVAHSAQFEQAIWRNIMVPVYGFPPIPIERWDCTQAACAMKGWPLKLQLSGRLAGAAKDMVGNKLTLDMSRPEKRIKHPDYGKLPEITPECLATISSYCKQDVVVEEKVLHRVGLISKTNPHERRIWELDQKINQRGIRIDTALATVMQRIIDRASVPLLDEYNVLTRLSKIGSPKLKEWCAEHGVPVADLQKGTIAKILETDDEDDAGYESLAGDGLEQCERDVPVEGLPANVRRVLEIRQMLGGAAIKKVKRMLACTGYDGRARGLLQYYAAHSGRWGGRLLQPQNFPRESLKGIDPDFAVEVLLTGDPMVVERELGVHPLRAVALCLRYCLIPDPGKVFLLGDYKSIEAVIVLALAGHYDLAQGLAGGQPVYMEMAEQIYNQPKGTWAVADKELYKKYKESLYVQEYTAGKAAVLGAGYQMGADKFKFMCSKNYNIEISQETAEDTITAYRKKFAPKVPPLWYNLDEISLSAVKTGQVTGLDLGAGRSIQYREQGEWLVCDLPNGWQHIWYPKPRIGVSRFDNECWQYMKMTNKGLVNVDMYGGIETENVVQALARGILCGAMLRLEEAGFPLVLTVHDECVAEVDEDKADMLQFEKLMVEGSPWIDDLQIPLAVEASCVKRYKK